MYILANGTTGYIIWKFDSSGVFIKTISLNTPYPQLFTIDNLGSLFVKKDNVTYAKYDENGNELVEFGGFGSADGLFGDISSVIRMQHDISGNIYIVDWNNDRIQVFNNEGSYLRKWFTNGTESFWCDTNLENGKYYTKAVNTLYEYDINGNLLHEYFLPEQNITYSYEDRFLVFSNRLYVLNHDQDVLHIFKFLDNQLPIAEAGTDQIVFDQIVLDGSHSEDSGGEIISYSWQLSHREKPEFNRNATGVTPTILNLKKGFYDVTLTVEDNEGAFATDTMIFTATGIKGDFDFDEDVDADDLAIFATTYGTNLGQ